MGESGSESMVMLDQSNCLNAVAASAANDFTGAWYNPAESGWGASVHLREGAEFTGFFLYDALGEPRWVLASENRATLCACRFTSTKAFARPARFSKIPGAKSAATSCGLIR